MLARRAGPRADSNKATRCPNAAAGGDLPKPHALTWGPFNGATKPTDIPSPRRSPTHFLQTNPANAPVRVTMTSRYMLRSRSSRLSAVSKGGVKNPIGTQNARTKRSVTRFCPLDVAASRERAALLQHAMRLTKGSHLVRERMQAVEREHAVK